MYGNLRRGLYKNEVNAIHHEVFQLYASLETDFVILIVPSFEQDMAPCRQNNIALYEFAETIQNIDASSEKWNTRYGTCCLRSCSLGEVRNRSRYG